MACGMILDLPSNVIELPVVAPPVVEPPVAAPPVVAPPEVVLLALPPVPLLEAVPVPEVEDGAVGVAVWAFAETPMSAAARVVRRVLVFMLCLVGINYLTAATSDHRTGAV